MRLELRRHTPRRSRHRAIQTGNLNYPMAPWKRARARWAACWHAAADKVRAARECLAFQRPFQPDCSDPAGRVWHFEGAEVAGKTDPSDPSDAMDKRRARESLPVPIH